jgi:hypothetical protein
MEVDIASTSHEFLYRKSRICDDVLLSVVCGYIEL